jgi:hypothetical protein
MSLENDPTISDDTILFRRIPPGFDHVRWDPNSLEPSITSGNFKGDNQLSFHLAHLTTPDDILKGFEDFGLVSITVAELRSILGSNLEKICADPEDVPPDPAHKIVCAKVTN